MLATGQGGERARPLSQHAFTAIGARDVLIFGNDLHLKRRVQFQYVCNHVRKIRGGVHPRASEEYGLVFMGVLNIM